MLVAIGGRSLQSEDDKRWIQRPDVLPGSGTARRRAPRPFCFINSEAAQLRKGRARPGQFEPFNERHILGSSGAGAGVRARVRVASGAAAVPVQLVPPLQCSQFNSGIADENGEGYLVFDGKSKDSP
ncbi:hypothetical protein ASF06_06425 [Agreia sp. Leaf244]|nr:hypothetical protein ASE64_07540 [Agreia sp. Leaf210]KQO09882.1 hypothetical protein ASF06_06425 [Agreia sp. Leaf244]